MPPGSDQGGYREHIALGDCRSPRRHSRDGSEPASSPPATPRRPRPGSGVAGGVRESLAPVSKSPEIAATSPNGSLAPAISPQRQLLHSRVYRLCRAVSRHTAESTDSAVALVILPRSSKTSPHCDKNLQQS